MSLFIFLRNFATEPNFHM
ncbi:Protein of unknown function [Bacillus mobilis]|nr:Protein of unknown function [Bacillus mobilis]